MLQHTLILLSVFSSHTQSFITIPNLLFSDKSNSCNCPCRTNIVGRCIQTYEDKCQADPYDPYNQKCIKHPVMAVKNVSETECQVCRNIWETEMVNSFKWSCDPVYDESCNTEYPQKCYYKKKCPTSCSTQDCSDEPYKLQYCKKVKYCSRKPHTTCTPVKRSECSMKKILSPKKVSFRCIHFTVLSFR